MPLPDCSGRDFVARQMHLLAAAGAQALFANRIQKAGRRAMIQEFRRRQRRKAEVNRKRMPLIGADAQAVFAQGETLFVILRDNRFQQRAIQRNALFLRRRDEIVNRHPSARIRRQPDRFRLMTQHETYEFADIHQRCLHIVKSCQTR